MSRVPRVIPLIWSCEVPRVILPIWSFEPGSEGNSSDLKVRGAKGNSSDLEL